MFEYFILGVFVLAAIFFGKDIVNIAIVMLKDFTGMYPGAAIDLETVYYHNTDLVEADEPKAYHTPDMQLLVAKDGSLGFVIEIQGSLSITSNSDWYGRRDVLEGMLSPLVGQNGVVMQNVFYFDPFAGDRVAKEVNAPARETAKNLHLDWDFVFDAQENYLGQFIHEEHNYVCVWVTPEILPTHTRKDAYKKRSKLINGSLSGIDIQHIHAEMRELVDRALALRSGFVNAYNNAGLACQILSAEDSIKSIRRTLFPKLTTDNWSPYLPKDRLPGNIRPSFENGTNSIGDILWPALETQIIPVDPIVPTPNRVELAGRKFATLSLKLLPKEFQNMQRFITQVSNTNIPICVATRIQGNGPAVMSYKKTMASVLSFDPLSQDNKKIVNAGDEVEARELESIPQVVIQTDIITWTDKDDKQLNTQVENLIAAYQQWGGSDIESRDGNAWKTIVSTLPCARIYSSANRSCCTLGEAIAMMPISRPTLPWAKGAMMLRSLDGKILPYQPGSSIQSAQVTALAGPMGFGKSLYLSALVKAVITSPNEVEWPLICMFDIGPSSEGVIRLIQDGLPPSMGVVASHQKLIKDPETSAINPFDTPLGCWEPFPSQKDFLRNLLTLIAPELVSFPGLINRVIDEVYRRYSPLDNGGKPKPYAPGYDAEIDKVMRMPEIKAAHAKKYGNSPITWWDVVDIFFKQALNQKDDAAAKPFLDKASFAQRYAVPCLQELTGIPTDPEIAKIYEGKDESREGAKIINTNENPTSYFARVLLEAVDMYPHISRPSTFVLGDAKIVALDLMAVCPKGDGQAKVETAIMYMVARQMAAGKFYDTEYDVPLIRRGKWEETEAQRDKEVNKYSNNMFAEYRRYHSKRIAEIKRARKLIIYDEYHRTEGQKGVETQIIQDIREGRKWKVWIILASQSLKDFPKTMMEELVTTVIILGTGLAKGVSDIAESVGLNEAATTVLSRLTKAGREGSNAVSLYKTEYGTFIQHSYLTLGPTERWAFETDPINAEVRNTLYQKIGQRETLRLLSKKYPSGCTKEVEYRKQNSGKKYDDNDEETIPMDIILQLIDELVAYFEKNQKD